MENLIKEKGQILMICTGRHMTKNGGAVKHYKMFVMNKQNTFLYDISYIMQNIGFKVNEEKEILIKYSGSHKDMVMDEISKYLGTDIQVITD